MNEALRSASPRRLLLLAAIGGLAASGALAPEADASFTLSKCGGTDIQGQGASFARDAHVGWRLPFRTLYCSGAPDVVYSPTGSGAGRRIVGERTRPNASVTTCEAGDNTTGCRSRNQPDRFGMTDEPPKPTGINEMNIGTDAPGDEGKIHVIPAAVGAVAMIVNWPNNCDRSLLDDASETAPTATNFTNRVRFTKAEYEEIWWGDTAHDNWTEIFPELAADTDCDVPIKRVVRFDDSGTTFAFKDFLNTINPSRPLGARWLPDFDARNNRWPNHSPGHPVHSGPNPGSNDVLSGGANGNGPLSSTVAATDGSVGYSDISTARNAGFAITPTSSAGSRDDDQFWVPLPNGSATDNNATNSFAEPTSTANGFRTDGDKGSNCELTTFRNVPGGEDATLGDWGPVSGVNSAAGYGICTLTYILAFDDNATAYGNTPAEEAKARTVKDYADFIVSTGGQGLLPANDYGPLPADLLAKARTGVNAIGWNKAGVGQNTGGDNPPPGGGGNTPPPGGGTNNPPPPVNPGKPSNVFSIPSGSAAKNGTITLNLRVPGAGVLRGVATAKTKKIGKKKAKNLRVGAATLSPTGAGTFKLVIKPSRATLAALKKQKSLKVKVEVSFTPAGGDAATQAKTVTLKAAKKK